MSMPQVSAQIGGGLGSNSRAIAPEYLWIYRKCNRNSFQVRNFVTINVCTSFIYMEPYSVNEGKHNPDEPTLTTSLGTGTNPKQGWEFIQRLGDEMNPRLPKSNSTG